MAVVGAGYQESQEWGPCPSEPWSAAQWALGRYSAAIKRTPFDHEQLDQICSVHGPTLAHAAKRLPQIPQRLPGDTSGSATTAGEEPPLIESVTESLPKNAAAAIMQAMSVLDKAWRNEARLAPPKLQVVAQNASVLMATEAVAAELAGILVAAPSWRWAQVGQWAIVDTIERGVSFLIWIAKKMQRLELGSDDYDEEHELNELRGHAVFLQQVGRVIRGTAVYLQGGLGKADPVRSWASRWGDAARALIERARLLQDRAEAFHKQHFPPPEKVEVPVQGILVAQAAQAAKVKIPQRSILGLMAARTASGKTTEEEGRRREVDADINMTSTMAAQRKKEGERALRKRASDLAATEEDEDEGLDASSVLRVGISDREGEQRRQQEEIDERDEEKRREKLLAARQAQLAAKRRAKEAEMQENRKVLRQKELQEERANEVANKRLLSEAATAKRLARVGPSTLWGPEVDVDARPIWKGTRGSD